MFGPPFVYLVRVVAAEILARLARRYTASSPRSFGLARNTAQQQLVVVWSVAVAANFVGPRLPFVMLLIQQLFVMHSCTVPSQYIALRSIM